MIAHVRLVFFTVLFLSFFLQSTAQQYTYKQTIGTTFMGGPADVVIDPQGYMYVSSRSGGYIAKLDSNGVLQSFIGSPGSGDGQLNQPKGIALDSKGNLWVLDDGRVQKFNANGKFLLKVATLPLSKTSLIGWFGITTDSEDNVWIVDFGNNRVIKLDANGKLLLSFGSEGSGDGQFSYPADIAIDTQGNIWVTDAGNQRLQKFDPNGKFLSKFGTPGTPDGQLNSPQGITLDKQGNIWVVDDYSYVGDRRIQKFDPNGKFLLKCGLYGWIDGKFDTPLGITTGPKGTIWVVDVPTSSNLPERIQQLDTEGRFLSKITVRGSAPGQLNYPQGIAIDRQGGVWIADTDNNKIQKFDSNGKFLFAFGSRGSLDGKFVLPQGIAVDSVGNVWVLDTGNDRIQKFDSKGKFLLKIGNGHNDGPFHSPDDMTIDKDGNLWVVEQGQNRIQKFDSKGNVLFTLTTVGSGPGQFNRPRSIKADKDGNIWVADVGNSRVNKYTASAAFLMSIDSRASVDGKFSPYSMATDTEGNVWVSDIGNNRFQTFDKNGKYLSKTDLPRVYPRHIVFDQYNTMYWTNMWGALIYGTEQYNPAPSVTDITGSVFYDQNQNCTFDAGDTPLAGIVMRAQPGNWYGITGEDGYYRILVDPGTYTVTQVGDNTPNRYRILEPLCPATNVSRVLTITTKGERAANVDFANKGALLPFLTSQVSSNRRRRCFTNATTVSYANSGLGIAQNVKVYVKMPPYVILKSADRSYTIDRDSNYVFTIGMLKPYESGIIQITDSVVCNNSSIRGLTACTKVWITPSNSYTLPPDSPWDNSDLVLSGNCIENGRVRLVIKNTGRAAMADSAEFRVLLDARLSLRKNYKLAAGDSLVLRVPANGKTVRLEADQRPGHPRKSQSNLTIEGCVATSSDVVSKGFVDVLPQDDAEPEVAISCLSIVDSFDPNDKLVSPAGTTGERYTPTDSELKYTIRFQNTGTDYAYRVTIIDTLSDNLDIASLQMGAASHLYTLDISGKGRPVLTFTFSNINLPDSTRDQKGSNGFVQFSIKTKAGLAEKARIENFADIFFDYNEPVRTNTTTNVMYDEPRIVEAQDQLNERGVVFLAPTIRSFTPDTVQVGQQLTIRGTHYPTTLTDNTVKINGVAVPVISATETELVVKAPEGVTSGKISVTTPGGTGISAADLIILQPPVIQNFTPELAGVGEQITIKGINFDAVAEKNTVQINGVQATVVSATTTQLVILVPANVTSGKISVSTRGGTAISANDFTLKPTATEGPEWSRGIEVFPNPSNGKLIIDLSQSAVQLRSLKVCNHLGQTVALCTFINSESRKEVDLEGMGSGLYLLIFKTNKGDFARKVIVK